MPTDPSTGSGSAPSGVEGADRRSRIAASILALLTAVSIWLSAGILYIGDTGSRIAALPSITILIVLALALPAAAWVLKLRLDHAWPLAISLILWLPFLGAPPLWDGPIEGVVWLVVIVGLIAARTPIAPAALSDPRIAPWIAASAIALASLIVFGQVRNVIPGGDEPHYLAATQSLIKDADLRVANNYAKGDYLDYFAGRLEPHYLKRSTSGEIYSIHAPGVSVIVLPAFVIAGYTGAVWTMILFASLTAGLMWRVAFAVSSSAAAAWAAVLGVCFSAPFFLHTFTIYPEMIGAFCTLAAVWLLIELGQGGDVSDRRLVAAGALLAILPWLHTRFALLAASSGMVIAARLIARPSPLRRIAAFLAVPAVAAVAWFAFFYVIWGSPSPTAPYGADTSTSLSYAVRGLIGLLFDQQFGVITTAPIYAMAIFGTVALLRTRMRASIELALIVVPYAIAVASYAMWWGGAAAPGRFLVAILPLAAIPIAAGYAAFRNVRAVTLILIAVSAALVLPRAFEDSGRFIYNTRGGIDGTLRWLSSANLPAALPSVHRDAAGAAIGAGLIWFTALAAVLGVLRLATRNSSSGARFALAGVLLAMAVLVCAPATTLAGHHELSTLARLRPWHTTIVDRSTWQQRSAADLLGAMPIAVTGAQVLDRVPAGEYLITPSAGSTFSGPLRIQVGRNDAPFAELHFDDQHRAHVLRLPVMARTLYFRTPAGPADALTLQPAEVFFSSSRKPATRAAQYGGRRAFFFDEWLYPERDGFWTRANGTATVVIDSDQRAPQPGLPLSVIAGAVPTTITLSTDGWENRFALVAGEKQDVVLPASDTGTWTLRIRSGDGFRPFEHEPGSTDVRSLAAWIALLR